MALSNPTSHFLVWMKEAKQKQNLSRRGAARRQKMGESDSGGGGGVYGGGGGGRGAILERFRIS